MTYYKQKAIEIEQRINTAQCINGKPLTSEQLVKAIEFGLKEVNRDIKHQLVDTLYLEKYNSMDDISGRITNEIMNFEPKIKEGK